MHRSAEKRSLWLIQRLPSSFVPRLRPRLFKTANRSGFCLIICPRMLAPMDTKSRDSLYGSWVRAAAERAGLPARKPTSPPARVDPSAHARLQRPTQPSPSSAMRSMPAISISKSAASAATCTGPLRSIFVRRKCVEVKNSPQVLSGYRYRAWVRVFRNL